MPRIDKTFAGAAASATISGSMTSGSPAPGATFSISSGSGWPTGAHVAVIDRGEATEEKVFISGRSGTTLTVGASGRGYDGTAAAAHSAGATIQHILDAETLQDIVDILNQTGAAEDPFPQYLLETAHTKAAHVSLGLAASDDSRFTDTRTPTDGSVTNAKMADNAINTAELVDSAVTSAKIAAGTIVAADIANDTITATQVAADAIGTSELADSAVATANLADASVTAAKIGTGAATTAYADLVAAAAHAGSIDIGDSAVEGAWVGTAPAASATTYRVIAGNQAVVFTAGTGVLTLPTGHNLAGIITATFTTSAGTAPRQIGRNTGGTTNANQIALHGYDKDGAALSVTQSVGYVIVGWEA
jgi:hypothetical protein